MKNRIIVVYDDLICHTMADGLVEDHRDSLIEEFKSENKELMPVFGNQNSN